jgi:hypothetical protein
MEIKNFIIAILFIVIYIIIIDVYRVTITLKNKIIDYVRKKRNRKKIN